MDNPKFERAEDLGKNIHTPVFKKEIIEYLNPKPNENFIDCTIGGGGHATAIIEKNRPRGKVLGIEIDSELYKRLETIGIQRLILINDSYINLEKIVEKCKFGKISGILFDLGLSSWHLEKSGRGFTFLEEEPLIMRYDGKRNQLTAKDILNNWPEAEIERILREYGEERFSKNIAREIIKAREEKPINTTSQLVEIIKKSLPAGYLRSKNNRRRGYFAVKTFQALRIAVNNELRNLEESLPQALEILETGGRLAIISFHSLEDRIVKNFFRNKAREGLLKILTKKPIIPKREEVEVNPRARSAKLRAAIKQ
jgi:16S rRNA (cytosine1402-N4)-methyltransferase